VSIAAACLLAVCAYATSADDDKPPLTWAVVDLPPVYILADQPSVENLGDGVSDRLLRMTIGAMPEYRHTVMRMTLPRVLLEMRNGTPLCIMNVQRSPERDAVAYSTPLLLAPSLSIVMRDDVLKQHPTWRDGVPLHELVKDANLHGIYLADRTFGPQLDIIIQSPDNVGLKPNNGATGINMLKMIALGRADYSLDYPAMLAYLSRGSNLGKRLMSVPIAESAAFVEGHVLCTRSDWGKAAVTRIDEVLRDLAATPAYRESLYRWLPRDELARDRKSLDRFFDQRARKRYCSPSCP
jgi:uncharacterized protein (TIGR02285 family)